MSIVFFIIYFIVYTLDHVAHEDLPVMGVGALSIVRLQKQNSNILKQLYSLILL